MERRPGDGPDGPEVEESEPDVRFTYANERTFLAWNRTALALIATGVAATQLLPQFHVSGGRQILGVPLIAVRKPTHCQRLELLRESDWVFCPSTGLGLLP